MKICMLAFDFLPNPGGVAAHVYELSKTLVRHGHKVDVITYNKFNKKFYYQFNMDGFIIHAFRLSFLRNFSNKLNNLILLPIILIFLFKRLKTYDIFHFHGLFSLDYYILFLLRKYRRIKIVWTNHTSQFLELYEQRKIIKINKIVTLANKIIAPSQELAIKSWEGTEAKEENVFYIYNGVDTQKFHIKDKDVTLLKEFNIIENNKIALCARRFEKKNGIRYLLKAVPNIIKQLPEFRLILIGDYKGASDNSDKDYIRKFIVNNKLENYIICLGSMQHSELIQYYHCADITVLPSLLEAVSISGLESLACGKPIIGSNVGGIPEIIINGETGYLCPPKSSEELANNICNLLRDKFKLKEFSEKSRNLAVAKFSWDIVIDKVEIVYRAALCEK